MRLYPINSVSYTKSNIHKQKHSVKIQSKTAQNIPFKGLEAGAKGALGTLAGLGLGTLLTIGSGGILAPLLLSMGGCAAGCIKGSIDESAKEDNDDYDGYDIETGPWV